MEILESIPLKDQAFGLMVRDDCYMNQETKKELHLSNYISSGMLGQGTSNHVIFSRDGFSSLEKGNYIYNDNYKDHDIIYAKIERIGQRISCDFSINDNKYHNDYYDFDLTKVDNKNIYVGLFLNRGTVLKVNNINLTINEGEHVAFVGPSGGGKTTLASLAARFFDTTEGNISIGGVDVKSIPPKQLMDMVSFVFQDSKLLKMSILDNVRLGKNNATREEVLQALEDAQCGDIIAKLPDGIDTVIGTKGTFVSGGEAQRLSIARAMLKNAPILILDEATAFADPDNEAKVQQAFSKLSKGKTVIMIAHRLSSVTGADRICVLADGEITEMGTHDELLAKDGMYAHMWQAYNQSVHWKVGA
mgnify:CR=1 FL=1